jgi:excisionase family DNA binding protein
VTSYLTVREVAARLTFAKTCVVLKWIHAGQLAAVNVSSGRRPTWRIAETDLTAFLESRTTAPIRHARLRRRKLAVKRYF